jgi:hypothetical protein
LVDGSLHRPPKSAARGLIDWAVDLWPYVNGKALVSGLNLKEMDATDLVDVLHYFFEEDHVRYESSEHAESASKMRTRLYRDLYDRDYKYAIEASSNSTSGGRRYVSDSDESDYDEFARTDQIKPYIPPTQFNPDSADPFNGALDAPIR